MPTVGLAYTAHCTTHAFCVYHITSHNLNDLDSGCIR